MDPADYDEPVTPQSVELDKKSFRFSVLGNENISSQPNFSKSTAMSFGGALCTRCGQGFAPQEEMVNSSGEIWHTKCFVESGHGALGSGQAVGQDNLVLQLDRLDMEDGGGLQENRFPVDEDTQSVAESIIEMIEQPSDLQWHDSGLLPDEPGDKQPVPNQEMLQPQSPQQPQDPPAEWYQPQDPQSPLQPQGSPTQWYQKQDQKSLQQPQPQGTQIKWYQQQDPQSQSPYQPEPQQPSLQGQEQERQEAYKSGLKRQSSLQEARRRFQDIDDEEAAAKYKARVATIEEDTKTTNVGTEATYESVSGYDNTHSSQGLNEGPIEQEEYDEIEENLSKFPVMDTDIQEGNDLKPNGRPVTEYMNAVRPGTEYVNAPEGNKYNYGQDYDGGTLRAQSGGQQRSVADRYPTRNLPLPRTHKLITKATTDLFCAKCEKVLDLESPIVNYNGSVWHPQCFVCVQCFQPFPEGIFYEFEGRKYCEHDFHMLFAPCCGACGEFVVGRVIKAMNSNWHPQCFLCELCNVPLADAGFYKNAGRALCKECNNREKAAGMGKYVCHKCHSIIEEGHIKFKGEAFHPYHFNCTNCGIELNADAREKNGELFCLRCHDKMGIPICGACRRPIEERVVHALGKTWHVEHFVCAKCEKPFLGARHYEKRGLAYCEIHYHQLFGNICFLCNNVIGGDVFSALNKSWCTNHFACSLCDRKLSQKSKFFEFDLKPVCKPCYEHFPSELKKRMKKAYDQSPKK